jgi:Arylsulfotransferase (ASST)
MKPSRLFVVIALCILALVLGLLFTGCTSDVPEKTKSASAKNAEDSEVKYVHPTPLKSNKVEKNSGPKKEDPAEAERLEKLRELGYLQGTSKRPKRTGVRDYDPARAFNGINFYMAGHKPAAYLADMEGNVLHEWSYKFEDALPDFKITEKHVQHKFWRRAFMQPNGDLLAIFEGLALIKLDKNSKLKWIYDAKAPHHDLYVDKDGKIFLLTRIRAKHNEYRTEHNIWEDQITTLSPDGEEIESVSVLECLENSYYSPILLSFHAKYVSEDKHSMPSNGDLLHTNSIELIDAKIAKRFPMFEEGQALVSILYPNLIAAIDLEKKTVTWAMTGMWKRQHEAIPLDNGNILLFDNQGGERRSQVLEFNPSTQEVVWNFTGVENKLFYSYNCGTAYRLPNGNTLTTESARGNAFEVTPEKELVWRFVNPHATGSRNSLISTLFDVIRYGPDTDFSWMKKNPFAKK